MIAAESYSTPFYQGNTFAKPQFDPRKLDALVAKIHSFEKLPEGWHFGCGSGIWGGPSVSAQQIAWVGAQNGYDIEIFPGPDQDILIALNKGEFYYEVIANADSTISYFLERTELKILSREKRPLGEILEALNKDNNFIWFTIASSIPVTGIAENNDSSAMHSEIQVEEESRSSTANASRAAA